MAFRKPFQARYDGVGLSTGYGHRRVPDPGIARLLWGELGVCRSVINVGAGTGSYEPPVQGLVAVEPSWQMLAQRSEGGRVVRGVAEHLPFPDRAFDAAMGVLTIHHWGDWARGLREMARVARRVVLLTWDPHHPGFWLTQDYFPELLEWDRQIFPRLEDVQRVLGPADIKPAMIPSGCSDGFLGAYWDRPDEYLREDVRRSISSFSRIAEVETGIARLRADVESGVWRRRFGRLLNEASWDLGYRVVTWSASATPGSDVP